VFIHLLSNLKMEAIKAKIVDVYVAGETAKEATTPPLPVAIPLREQFKHTTFQQIVKLRMDSL